MELERLRILDMFLLYPSLLHRSSMPQDVKELFRNLDIEKPDKIFIRLPSPAAVIQDLRLYQNSAVAQLTAKGVIDSDALKQSTMVLSDSDLPRELRERTEKKNLEDGGLTSFLVGPFCTIPLRGSESVYRKAGLPTRAIAA
ncbi:MAG: hypothetical protein EOS86_33160 [Mesorhizobium sp.]|nr:ABC-three component system middle component 5 [Mesorhizobium sp.]RWQ61435.1 MAG: hypothetical protein EOS86_33160 [Mesorhizobium sp.]